MKTTKILTFMISLLLSVVSGVIIANSVGCDINMPDHLAFLNSVIHSDGGIMAFAVLNVASIQRAAEYYQPDLSKLPYAIMGDIYQKTHLNLIHVANKDIRTNFDRKGGIIKPYLAGTIDYTPEIGKATPRSLQVEMVYLALKDNITNYKAKTLLNPATETVNNKTKQHPQEMLILESIIRTASEDIVMATWHAAHNTADKTPFGINDGIHTLINADIAAYNIRSTYGNYVTSGAFSAPSGGTIETDTTAYNQLVTWLKQAAFSFQSQVCDLYMSYTLYAKVAAALTNKLKTIGTDVTPTILTQKLRDVCLMPNLNIIIDPSYGTGDRLLLTVPGNIEIGMNTEGDEQFVQIRDIYEDPNDFQFWSQFAWGARVNQLNKKVFMVNEQVNAAITDLSGDYVS